MISFSGLITLSIFRWYEDRCCVVWCPIGQPDMVYTYRQPLARWELHSSLLI